MIAHLILAAGSSSRLGFAKQLLDWGGRSLLQQAVLESLKINKVKTYVVLGFNIEKFQREIKNYNVVVVENKNWDQGIGTSISKGVQQIKKERIAFQGILISLVDQPLLDHFYLQQMISRFLVTGNVPIAANYGSRVGVPAIFPKTYFHKLIALSGDEGAKKIINALDSIETIKTHGLHLDIDTVEDYEKVKKVKGNFAN